MDRVASSKKAVCAAIAPGPGRAGSRQPGKAATPTVATPAAVDFTHQITKTAIFLAAEKMLQQEAHFSKRQNTSSGTSIYVSPVLASDKINAVLVHCRLKRVRCEAGSSYLECANIHCKITNGKRRRVFDASEGALCRQCHKMVMSVPLDKQRVDEQVLLLGSYRDMVPLPAPLAPAYRVPVAHYNPSSLPECVRLGELLILRLGEDLDIAGHTVIDSCDVFYRIVKSRTGEMGAYHNIAVAALLWVFYDVESSCCLERRLLQGAETSARIQNTLPLGFDLRYSDFDTASQRWYRARFPCAMCDRVFSSAREAKLHARHCCGSWYAQYISGAPMHVGETRATVAAIKHQIRHVCSVGTVLSRRECFELVGLGVPYVCSAAANYHRAIDEVSDLVFDHGASMRQICESTYLEWCDVGAEPPSAGKELRHPALARKLQQTRHFTEIEWGALRIKHVPAGAFVKVEVDGAWTYLQAAGEGKRASFRF